MREPGGETSRVRADRACLVWMAVIAVAWLIVRAPDLAAALRSLAR